jgi:phosphoribosylcarboxyaminoimidazole (NCAIR) mutase
LLFLRVIIFSFVYWNVVAPRVGIIMGSDSDLPVMKSAAEILEMFGVPHEVRLLKLP